MRLDPDACWARLGRAGHGVLATLHPQRGVDAVPVVYAVHGGRLLLPIDTVKAKSGRPLQRLANIAADDRCAVLVDHYDDEWSQLWWVRVHGRAVEVAPADGELEAFATAFPPYRAPGSVPSVLAVTVAAVTGWAADG